MKKELINLHIHTDASDGEYEVNSLINMIKDTNLKTFSITDHDTIEAYNNIDNTLLENLTLINGCEFSAKPLYDKKNARLHILGYDLDLNNDSLKRIFDQKRENDTYNLLLQIYYLEKVFGISFNQEEIEKILQRTSFGRPDIAKLLIKYNYANNFNEAFEKYLIDIYEISKTERKQIEMEEVFKTIKQANGYISIAHIKSNLLDDKETNHFLELCKSYEVDAIELYHPSHDENYRNYLTEKIDNYNFLISGGTDYHGPNTQPNRFLEYSSQDNIKIKKLSLVDKILQK